MNTARCRSCQATIVWIKTPTGKRMPCDTSLIIARLMPPAPGAHVLTLVTARGEIVRGVESANPKAETVEGYWCHWSTCPDAAHHRRKERR